jgi:hypothetical protein
LHATNLSRLATKFFQIKVLKKGFIMAFVAGSSSIPAVGPVTGAQRTPNRVVGGAPLSRGQTHRLRVVRFNDVLESVRWVLVWTFQEVAENSRDEFLTCHLYGLRRIRHVDRPFHPEELQYLPQPITAQGLLHLPNASLLSDVIDVRAWNDGSGWKQNTTYVLPLLVMGLFVVRSLLDLQLLRGHHKRDLTGHRASALPLVLF